MDSIFTTIWSSILDTITGLFDFDGRLGLPFLSISCAVAYVLYRLQARNSSGFWQFLGGSGVWWHRSARLDYLLYFLKPLLHAMFIAPTLLWLSPLLFSSDDVIGVLKSWFDDNTARNTSTSIMLFYGLSAFLVNDFTHYWVHRAFHCRWLWEFHKVHHSAVVMVPATASRIHFFERLCESIIKGCMFAVFNGMFFWICGGKVNNVTLLGIGYLSFVFNSLGSNLRHSHVWFSFGPRLEHVLNSPAQHQIHHSRNPKHYSRNFGINLSIWDWMFGTLYVTTHQPETLEFGVMPKDNERYQQLHHLLFRPFWVTFRKIWLQMSGQKR